MQKGTTLVIKFQAKSAVHHALSFASLLNMHEFILHERAGHGVYTCDIIHDLPLKRKRKKGQYLTVCCGARLPRCFFFFFLCCTFPYILPSIVILNQCIELVSSGLHIVFMPFVCCAEQHQGACGCYSKGSQHPERIQTSNPALL